MKSGYMRVNKPKKLDADFKRLIDDLQRTKDSVDVFDIVWRLLGMAQDAVYVAWKEYDKQGGKSGDERKK